MSGFGGSISSPPSILSDTLSLPDSSKAASLTGEFTVDVNLTSCGALDAAVTAALAANLGLGIFCHQCLIGWLLRRQVVVCVSTTGFVARTFHRPGSYAIQCGVVEAPQKIGSSADGLRFATRVRARSCGSDVAQCTDDQQILARPLTRDGMREFLSSMASRHCSAVEAVASENSGAGKTFEILRQVKQLQDEVDASVLHYVAIRETTSVGQFVEALKSDKTDPDKPTAVYLDLAHILPVSADVWLFELLVVGAVRDPIDGNVYHRRRADHFYIEVPNSPHERTASSLSFCALLPVSFLRMEASRLEWRRPGRLCGQ